MIQKTKRRTGKREESVKSKGKQKGSSKQNKRSMRYKARKNDRSPAKAQSAALYRSPPGDTVSPFAVARRACMNSSTECLDGRPAYLQRRQAVFIILLRLCTAFEY